MIKLIKKQQGLPFLLALGVMFVLSASFLAVQLWSDDDRMRGAAAALEAPVMPPDLNAPTIVPPPQEGTIEAKSIVEALEGAESDEKAASTDRNGSQGEKIEVSNKESHLITLEKPVEEDLKAAEEIDQPKVAKLPAREAKTGTSAKKEKPAVVLVKDKKLVEVSSQRKTVKEVQKIAKKLVKTEKEPAPVPTEIPPEWNWFQHPLKLDIENGKVEISSDIIPTVKIKTAKKQVVKSLEPIEKRKIVPTVKPFATAMAKMAKLKKKRVVEKTSMPKRSPVVVEKATVALNRLQDMVRYICCGESQRRNQEVLGATSLPVALEKSVEQVFESTHEGIAGDEEAEAFSDSVESTDDGSYDGSGSSFSMRINELIRSGAWLRD